jgi:peptide/nickel transport system ATP-binding protein
MTESQTQATTTERTDQPLLEVKDLSVTFHTPTGSVRAIRNASFNVHRGEVVGLVGESGCGKSTSVFAVMSYLPGAHTVGGSIRFDGRDMADISPSELRQMRGDRIAMVYQDPAVALNPTMKVGAQIEEVLAEHGNIDSHENKERVTELFDSVGLPDPERIAQSYPHQLSGGQQQRIVIAMALSCDPDLLLMDEPTTGLDVTTEATILDLISDLKDRVNAGILYVTHNLGVIARVADTVVVMYAGQTVEQAPVKDLFKNPRHPYTQGMLSCVPTPATASEKVTRLRSIPGTVYSGQLPDINGCLFVDRCPIAQDQCRTEAPSMLQATVVHQSRCFFWSDVKPDIWGEAEERQTVPDQPEQQTLAVKGLRRFYGKWQRKYLLFGPRVRPPVRAVEHVDFDISAGRTIGIVGESGSGKTTLARSIVGLVPRDAGDLELKGDHLAPAAEKRTRAQRAAIRMVFQNPTSSLNPKLPVKHAILRPLKKFTNLNAKEREERTIELLESVGLDASFVDRQPLRLSGGQQQRVAIAAAFAGDPPLIVADEPVSALDVSVQAQVLNLLQDRQRDQNTSYVFISHDLGVVRYVSDEIVVMYAGRVAESGPAESVLSSPSHPYTEALLSAAPIPDPEAPPTPIRLSGTVPTQREQFPGCSFAARCHRKLEGICDSTPPPAQVDPDISDHIIHCHIPTAELTVLQKQPVPAPAD